MKCPQIRNMISPYVDDELTPDEKEMFESHIRSCTACEEEMEGIRSLHLLFASAERFEAPPGFETRVMAHVREIKEAGGLSRLWRLVTGRPLFLRAVEVAFALVVMLIGAISGNLLVADRRAATQMNVGDAFSLDLFQATPPDSVGGAYARLAGVADEK